MPPRPPVEPTTTPPTEAKPAKKPFTKDGPCGGQRGINWMPRADSRGVPKLELETPYCELSEVGELL